MRIVVDAMGSDDNPHPDVQGAVMSAKRWGDPIILVGNEAIIKPLVASYGGADAPLEIVHAPEAIAMSDKPTEAANAKRQSSMHVGLQLVADGEADAFVTAGNTGAALAVATLYTLKRIRGVKRPALLVTLPSTEGFTLSIDAGANADSRPEHILQFAHMASIYAQRVMSIDAPKVALLSNGEEEGKGNEFTHETTPLLEQAAGINFQGNIEPKEVFTTADTDIVVHDGFTGNIMMKGAEGGMRLLQALLRREIRAGAVTTAGGLLIKPALERVKAHMDPNSIGGAVLLGVNGNVIIGHGGSNAQAIMNAVRQARRMVEGDLIPTLKDHFSR